MRRLGWMAATLAAMATAGCAYTAQDTTDRGLSPQQMALMERELGGKVAGRPMSCIPTHSTNDLVRVSDSVLLYRVGSNLVYKNELRGSCPGLSRDSDVIVSEVRGAGPCSGDIIRLVDRATGMYHGSCALGDFVPFRREN